VIPSFLFQGPEPDNDACVEHIAMVWFGGMEGLFFLFF
jgi:hypothetical protein